MKALRLPTRVSTVTYWFAPAAHAILLVRVPPWRSWRSGGLLQAGAFVAGCPAPVLARGREWDLSGLQAIHPVPLLRSRTPVEPTCPRQWRPRRCCPRIPDYEGFSENDFGANPQLQHLLPYASRVTLPHTCKARFRLAGCAFAGRVSNPLDRYERFQLVFTIVLLSCSPDATGIHNPGPWLWIPGSRPSASPRN